MQLHENNQARAELLRTEAQSVIITMQTDTRNRNVQEITTKSPNSANRLHSFNKKEHTGTYLTISCL